jgi:hypothetical protein
MKRLFAGIGTWLLAAALAPAADVADLVKQLKDSNADTRRAAAEALSKVGKEGKSAAPALVAALKDPDLFVRSFSAQALGQIDPNPKEVVPALRQCMMNIREKKEVHEAALASLGKLGTEAVGTLGDVAGDQSRDPDLRHKAVHLLGAMGPTARATVPILTEMGSGKGKNPKIAPKNSMELRVDAITALGDVATSEDTKAIEMLKELDGMEKLQRELKQPVKAALKKIEARK